MTEVRYAPGGWHVAVTARGVVVLGPEASSELATRVWSDVSEDRGLGAVLGALTGAFGTSLDAIPPFAVALEEHGSIRLAVRGDLTAIVDGRSSVETVSGAGVTTWSERLVPHATRTVIRTSAAGSDPADLPIRDGIVLASEISIAWTTDAADVAASGSPHAEVAAAPAPPAPPGVAIPAVAASAADGLIDSGSVPWGASPAAPAPAPDAAPAVPDTTLVPADTLLPIGTESVASEGSGIRDVDGGADVHATTGYDHLWGETVLRPLEDAAVREQPEEEADEASGTGIEGDHDGATISLAQARAMRSGLADSAPPPLAPPRAPAPGRVRISTGQVVTLDRTVVIGRRPRSTRVTGTDLPHLVAVDSPQQDISRSHLELRVEGDSIIATDLHTTNGTTLLRIGAAPVRLHPGEASVVVPGDVLDLGDDVTVEIEELS